MHEHEASVELTLNLNGEFHVHHHHHHNSPQPGAADIINSIQDSKEAIMTQLSDALAQLTADDAQLESEINDVLGKLAQVPGEIAAAVQAALDAANVDAATARDAVIAIDAGVKAAIDKVTAALNPGPLPPTAPTLTTTSLPDAVTGQAYSGQIEFAGGTGNVTVTNLPTDNGVTINADGTVTGTPAADTTSNFSVSFQDSADPPMTGSGTVSLVSAAAPVA